MEKNMKKIGLIIISLILLSVSISALQFNVIREATPTEELFSIFVAGNKTEFFQGEIVSFENFQDISENCSNLLGTMELIDSSGSVVDAVNKPVGQAGYVTIYFQGSTDTTFLEPGLYDIEIRWFCTLGGTNTYELGTDGFAPISSLDTTSEPDVFSFTVIEEDDPFPEPECSKTCSVGYELINPDSVDCFCQQTWIDDDGYCSVGEPVTNNDCIDDIQCGENQTLVDGVCVNMCPDGQTIDYGQGCPVPGFGIDLVWIGVIIVASILIVIGVTKK